MRPNLNQWRQSATLIIAAQSTFTKNSLYDYEILCLERSSKSSVFPNSYVFPGGNMSVSDCNVQWLDVFRKSGYKLDALNSLYPDKNIPPILKNSKETPDNIPSFLSLRICAIRETFEECGILICKSNKTPTKSEKWSSFISGYQVLEWQHKVHKSPEEFLNLCYHFDIYPDVWALKNWSNWTTPAVIPAKFDTMFFISTFNQKPTINMDETEIANLMWATPDEYVINNINGKVSNPPPQFYEIARLRNFHNIEKLAHFANIRSNNGCVQYLPYRVDTPDALYFIYPGDTLYPENINEVDKENIPQLDELPRTISKNRLLISKKNLQKKLFIANIETKDGHLVPKPYNHSQL